ncbi:MAG: hypothetical protein FI692_07745 [SAR202 cluster bacterium]|nr:hypothetical protein [SAR202 cluster bacterium]|tara:strand:+ start:8480 stop:8896 length:417 start_codon:yes stop_codon:yes gene_type:complete
MAKINITLGMTLKMATGGGYNFFRPELAISDIETQDADGNYNTEGVENQVKMALQGIHYTYSEVEQAMIQIVETSEVIEKEEVIIELRKKIDELKTRMDGMATSAPVAESALVESTDTTTVEDAPVASTEDDEDDDDW